MTLDPMQGAGPLALIEISGGVVTGVNAGTSRVVLTAGPFDAVVVIEVSE